jgi:hypothetical protein
VVAESCVLDARAKRRACAHQSVTTLSHGKGRKERGRENGSPNLLLFLDENGVIYKLITFLVLYNFINI